MKRRFSPSSSGVSLVVSTFMLAGSLAAAQEQGRYTRMNYLYSAVSGPEEFTDADVEDSKSALNKLGKGRENNELKSASDDPAKFEKELEAVDKFIDPEDHSHKKFKVKSSLHSNLDQGQKKTVDELVHGLNKQLEQGAIHSGQRTNHGWEFKDNTSQDSKLPDNPPNFTESHTDGSIDLGNFTNEVDPEHIGTGTSVQWSWRWWGVKIRFGHSAAYYACHYTSWVMGWLPLPGWVEGIIKLAGCSLHSLDSDLDGTTLNITWVLVFWFSDSF